MKYKKSLCLLGLLIILFTPSCNGFVKKKRTILDIDYKVTQNIEEANSEILDVAKTIDDKTTVIKKEAEKIKTEADIVEEKIPIIVKPDISPHIEAIKLGANIINKNANEIKNLQTNLTLAKTSLDDASKKIKDMEKTFNIAIEGKILAEKQLDKALERERDATRKLVKWLIIICTIGAGISLAIAIFGHFLIGGLLGVACVSTLTFAIMVDKYFDYIAYAGLAAVAIGVGFLIWKFFVRDKALKEVVHTTELTKASLPPAERTRLFGYNAEPGLVYTVQSTATEKLVNSARKKLKKQWDHTIPDPADDIDEHEKATRLARRDG